MRGHIRRRSKGSWSIVLDIGRDPATGKRKQQWVSVKGIKKDAERKLTEILQQLEVGAFVVPSKLTMREYLDRWLKDYCQVNLAPTTSQRHAVITRDYLIPSLGNIRIQELRPEHIQTFYTKMLTSGRRSGRPRGLAASTVRLTHRILFEALKHATKQGILIRNPAEAVDAPRVPHKEMQTLNMEEVSRLLKATNGTPYNPIYDTALSTGMRRSEILALQWGDIDLDLALLSVVLSLHRLRSGEFVFSAPKSAKSRRTVDLPPSLAILLRRHREKREAELGELGKTLTESSLVFSQLDGSPFNPDTVSQAFRLLARKLGLPTTRFHDLRHTHATLMLQVPIHPKIVSERLGHSSVAITLDLYSHVVPGLQAAAARRFDEFLSKRKGTGRQDPRVSKMLAESEHVDRDDDLGQSYYRRTTNTPDIWR